ncbi:MAG TPA: tetratricopeptide repeat protein, partial [Alphaproteobacteria bacterium]
SVKSPQAAAMPATPDDEAGNTFGDGQDLASLVLMAGDVRSGNYEEAQRLLNNLKAAPLKSFLEPVIDNWLNAGLGKPLSASTEGLSLLQALHRGLAAEWAKQSETADAVFDALARVPLTPEGAMVVAAYNLRRGRIDQARTALAEAIRQNPQDQDAKQMLDSLDQGQTPALKAEWSYHMQGVTAGVGLAMRDLAHLMVADEAWDSALIFGQLGRMVRADVPKLGLLIGTVFAQEKRLDDAKGVFESIPQGDPDYIEAQIQLADLLDEQGKRDQAIETLEKLMQAGPEPRIAYALGELYRSAKDFEKAVRAYDQALELSGGHVDDELWSIYYVRAMAYDELGEWQKSEDDLKTALTYRPDNPHVLNYLGYSYADRNQNLNEAKAMIIKALTQTPLDAYITDSLGWVYFREGDMVQASVLLERAVSLKPYDPTINDHLGDLYAKTGRYLEARYQWRRALDYADKLRDADLIEAIKKKMEAGAPQDAKTAG